jgi:hypothetical protein
LTETVYQKLNGIGTTEAISLVSQKKRRKKRKEKKRKAISLNGRYQRWLCGSSNQCIR